MPENQIFHTRTALAVGLQTLIQKLEQRLCLSKPLNVYLAGGMAVHLYTADRVTTDVDAEFSARVLLPSDLMVEVTMEDGTQQVIYFDTNYNSSFALMHEDYQDDAIPIDIGGVNQVKVYVLAPVDLAVSKISRFWDNDKDDIKALVRAGLTTSEEIEQRATAALAGYVGGQEMVRLNLRDALIVARKAERAARDERLANLSSLEKRGGVAYTFWKNATTAIAATRGSGNVRWQEVETATILQSVGEFGQSPQDVVEIICQSSPGAISLARQASIRSEVEEAVRRFQVQTGHSLQTNIDRDHPNDGGPSLN